MLQPSELRRLAELDTRPHPTLSLYLALDQSRDQRLLALSQMAKRQEQKHVGNGSAAAWKELAADLDRTTRFVEELPAGPHKGLALFACAGRDLFAPYTLALSVPNLMEVGTGPYIRPLSALVGDHLRSLMVVLDRRRARFLEGFLGAFVEIKELALVNQLAPYERDGDQGRTGDSSLSRREEVAMGHFCKEIGQRLMAEFKARDCQELLVGGAKGAVEALLPGLHPYLGQKLAGSFICDPGASLAALSEEAMKAQAEARLQRQARLLATLNENLGRKGQAATGLMATLEALHEGKVHTLFLRRGLTQEGGACPACGRLRHQAGACPLCKAEMTPVEDVVNLAVARALDSGAALVQVEGDSPLDQMGGVAALLRYA